MSGTAPQPLDVFGVPLDGIRLIEASAGTGKTWAICGLYLRLLLQQRLPVQQILVVTFTNAATAELRERVRSRLIDTLAGLQAPPVPLPGDAATGGDRFVPDLLASLRAHGLADADMAGRLAEALQTFDEAAIFTIHGFCQRALADAPFAARMPLVQALLADDSALLMEAVHDFWRQRVAGAQASPALAATLLAHGDTPERWARLLKRQLAKPLSRLLWPADLDAPCDGAALHAGLLAAFEAARQAWPAQRAAVLATLKAALPRLNGTYYKPATPQASAEAWDALLARPTGPSALDAETLKPLALLGSRTLQLRARKGEQPPVHPFFDTAQAVLDAVAATDRQQRLARLRLLRDLLDQAAHRLREAKRARRVVAFDDMLFNLHQRLQGDGGDALAQALRGRFPAALIDEFQDTDPLQWAVFHRVYATPAAAGGTAPTLVLVGDPKQAIYSFRHADLHTYLQARAQARAATTLASNQRATAPLIDALNRLFGHHPQAFMQPGLHYQPVSLGAKPRAPLVDRTDARAALQVWTLPLQPRSGQPPLKAVARDQASATCAGEIARLLGQARAGAITLGGAPLRAGHIAVLVRSHAQGSLMRQALAARGVGSVELSQASVFHSPDADELARVLAAMLSPGHDGLAKAALATRCLGLAADQIDALAGDETAWLDRAQRLAAHGALWRQRGVGLMLQHWRQTEGVAERLLAQPDGARRLTNLLHLGELLHQASTSQPSPEALLRWLQAQAAEGGADEAAQLRLESDQNLVQIVTIHKSKGLEYPIVFCPFLWDARSGGSADGLDGMAGHDDEGQAVVDFRAGLDDAFDEAAAKAQARLENAAETLRLVYVALTRAVHRCYLVAGSYRAQAGKTVSANESARSLLNWLVMGTGVSPEDWFSTKRPVAEPAAIAAAWAALVPGTTPLPAPGALALAHEAPPEAAPNGTLQALAAPARLPAGWWIASYSSLAERADAAAGAPVGPASAGVDPLPAIDSGLQLRAGADHDGALAEPVDNLPAAAPAGRGGDDILAFPRGTLAGECVHAAFEHADFTQPASWPAAIAQALQRHPSAPGTAAPAHAAMLHNMLADVLATPLPVGAAAPLHLASLAPAQRLNELEFHLRAPQLSASALNTLLAQHGYPVPRLGFGQLTGYLKGFIDLVFAHDGRYFIADWKSNHLGERPADYAGAGLAEAMAGHNYHLQYLLYSLALHRWLRHRRAGYQPALHWGGVLYLFVRGIRPGWQDSAGRPTGLFFHRPDPALLDRLDTLLDGGPA